MFRRDARKEKGEQLQRFLDQHDIKRSALARAAGIDGLTLGRILAGMRTPLEARAAVSDKIGRPGMLLSSAERRYMQRVAH